MMRHQARPQGRARQDIELTAAGHGNEDAQPLLEENVTVHDEGPYVHPLPNASYSCDERSWGSKLVFSWINPTLEKSQRGEKLQLEDTLHLPAALAAVFISERFERAWQSTVRRGHPSITAAFHSLFARDFWMAGIFRFATEMCKIFSPMIVREVILFVKSESTIAPQSAMGGLGLALLLLFVVLVQACTLQHFIHGGAGINTAATAAVYNKSLRLGRRSLRGSRLGQTLNFQAKDASKLRDVVVFFHNLWAAPLTAIGCTALLLYVLGPSSLVGICTIPILIPLETWVARRSERYRKSVLKVSDARISLLGEIIDGIKTVKLNSMGNVFRSRVGMLRQKELESIRQALSLNAYNQAVMRSSPIVVALATFTAYVLSGNKLDAQTAFTALALFNTVAHPFHVMPKAIQLYAEAKVSLQRLQVFLLEDETRRGNNYQLCASTGDGASDPKISIKDAAFSPVAGTACLEHVTAEIRRGLSVIVGPTGCGKTTLLLGLVEHLSMNDQDGLGVCVESTDGRVALCPDTPWIVNAAARDNICLGSMRDFDEGLYQRCVRACQLESDFADWPEGDRTVIGAKGITISGGQKARISLARALYARCSVVLLDDPLSALDTIVGSWVFQHAVCEMAKEAAVVMSTHQQQYIKGDCDVFILDQGRLQAVEDHRTLLGTDVVSQEDVLQVPSDGVDQPDQNAAGGMQFDWSKPAGVRPSLTGHLDNVKSSQAKATLQLSARVNNDRVTVPVNVYMSYLKACGIGIVVVTLSISVLAQVVDVSKEVVLAYWSDNPSTSAGTYLAWYAGVCLLVVIINCVRFFVVCWLGLRGSEALHESLLVQVMGAPLPFFQVTESGRITSRFSSDFDTIDLVIPTTLSSFMDAFLTMLAAVGVVVGTCPAFLVFILPIAFVYYRIQLTYRLSAKELKRLDSATKSPIYSHFHETLDGLTSVQAYGVEARMIQKNYFLIDANTRARLTWDATNRWLGIRLDFLGALVVFLATLMAVLIGRSTPGIVGLGLSYALTITRTLSFGVRSSTALENNFNSVERVQQFIALEQEEKQEIQGDHTDIPCPWPSKGIEFRDVYARHRPELPPVLNGVSLSVRCGERLGICGRSGSGKSSLALALVRVLECFQGSIAVDGQDIKEIPLSVLRSGVTVISQDAHLFSGTVREVMDPLGQCSDARIWDIAEMVGLKVTLANLPLGLLTRVSERGGNWSAGQRQLLCISRALVRQPGVLVFDEATANVDIETDAVIQRLISSYLSNASVIVIAHRLDDVMSCHRVLVMDAGRVAEEGTPSQLLTNENGMLTRLVKELGPELEDKLRHEHLPPRTSVMSTT